MQKFVVKKISRSTNITIAASEDQSLLPCGDLKPQVSEDLEVSSIKMSGYLKKKRNRVGGWNKLYFVLQNSLLMSYNSREEYEKKLVSFKDVICLIPGNTVLLPSLEPRFTIASNQNTFYTFRCDDNRTCSKWITAILECLSRDMDLNGREKKKPISSPTVNFHSQQNLVTHRPKPICQLNLSWENLPKSNWIANHNGRILLELNYMNCNRAKLPIAAKTAQLLQKCSDGDVITTTKKVNFIQNDENQNVLRNADHNEFRLHHEEEEPKKKSQLRNRGQINRMFSDKVESQQANGLNQHNGNDYNEIGVETQVQMMSFGDETYSSVNNEYDNYQSVDSKKFDNTLKIENFNENEETYAEIDNGNDYSKQLQAGSIKKKQMETKKSNDSGVILPVYASVDLKKKNEARREKSLKASDEQIVMNNLNQGQSKIYEDMEDADKINNHESNIYELIDIPLRPSRKSRSLVFKNWSRMHLFDFTKRFKETSEHAAGKSPSPETISKRQKASLTLSDFSKRFNYRSMRDKARKMCSRNNSTFVTSGSSEKDSLENDSSASDKAA